MQLWLEAQQKSGFLLVLQNISGLSFYRMPPGDPFIFPF